MAIRRTYGTEAHPFEATTGEDMVGDLGGSTYSSTMQATFNLHGRVVARAVLFDGHATLELASNGQKITLSVERGFLATLPALVGNAVASALGEIDAPA